MQSALTMALDQAEKAGATKVLVIRLRIGTMSGVVPEALQFAHEVLALGTLAEGSTLEIEGVKARFWCDACRREFESNELLSECPYCHVPSRNLRAGREMEVASMEIE